MTYEYQFEAPEVMPPPPRRSLLREQSWGPRPRYTMNFTAEEIKDAQEAWYAALKGTLPSLKEQDL
jgi:hypothetical protein